MVNLSNTAKADLWLLLVTILAAVSWMFSKEAILIMPPLLFTSLRFLLAGLLLSVLGWRQIKALRWGQYRQAMTVGSVFTVGMCFWIMGVNSGVSLSIGGFLTSLAVVFVPVFSSLFFNEQLPKSTWVAMPVAATGLAVLSFNNDFDWASGQLYFIYSAFFFAFFFIFNARAANQREYVEGQRPAERVPALPLTAISLLTVGLLSGGLSFILESWAVLWSGFTTDVVTWVVASAFIGTGLRFFIQTYAQSLSASSHGVVIMVVEPIWTALFAALWFSESLSSRDFVGCLLVFLSLLINRWSSITGLLKPRFR